MDILILTFVALSFAYIGYILGYERAIARILNNAPSPIKEHITSALNKGGDR